MKTEKRAAELVGPLDPGLNPTEASSYQLGPLGSFRLETALGRVEDLSDMHD